MMNRFDEKMRRRAAQEDWHTSPETDARLRRSLHSAAAERPRRRRLLLAVPIVAAAATLMLLGIRPAPDARNQQGLLPSATPAFVPLAQGAADELPTVTADYTFAGDVVQLSVKMSNEKDDDIWLAEYQAQLNGQTVRMLIWLEPGAQYQREYTWQDVQQDTADVQWSLAEYRVTAHTLHWMETQAYRDDEDYEVDQTILRDACAAGALILRPGEWENGEAGEMELLLPDEFAGEDALTYYATHGMLEEKLREKDTVNMERVGER